MREIRVKLFLNEVFDFEIFLIVDDEDFGDGDYLLELLKLIDDKLLVTNSDVRDGEPFWKWI